MGKNTTDECITDVIEGLRPMDEPLMSSVFRDKPQLMTDFLREATGKPGLQITKAAVPQDLPGEWYDPTLVFVAEVIDANGTPYRVEVYTFTEAMRQRKVYGAMIDDEWWTKRGEGEVSEQKAQSIMIYVTDFDAWRRGALRECVNLVCVDPPDGDFGPLPKSIYLYSGFDGPPPPGQERLADWVHDLGTANPSEMRIPELAQRVWMLKLDKKRCERSVEKNKTWEKRITAAYDSQRPF